MEVPGKKKEPSQSHTHPGVRDDARLYCQPCQKDGLRIPAHGYCQDCEEHLCESCYKTHRKPAPCRHHVLLDKTQMPKSQTPGQQQVPHDLTEQCQQHRGKVIEYFCRDHNVVGCSPCITINHRNCKIDYIPDVSENYVTGDQYRQLLHSLKTLQENLKKIINGAKTNKKKILENKATVKGDIKKFRQEVNSMFDELEANLQKEVDDLFAEESARIDSISTRSAKVLEDIESLQDGFNNLEKAKKTNTLYIQSKGNEVMVQGYTSAMVQTQDKNSVNTYKFEPNLALKKTLGSATRIGELQKGGFESSLTGSSKFKGMNTNEIPALQKRYANVDLRTKKDLYDKLSARRSGEINMKIPSDKFDCGIPGVVVIAKDTVAATDSSNNTVKIVDTKMKKVISNKTLSSEPEGLGIVPNNTLAVTLPRERIILFLSIPGGLSEVRRLKVSGKCCDLAYHNGKLIVAFEWPGKILVMSLEGCILKTLENDSLGNCFKSPMVTVVTNKNIYISDWNSSTITCMNLDGEVTKTYKDKHLVKPCGMVGLEDGSVLVSSSGNNSVCVISENLENGRVILEETDGLLTPWSLAIDKNKLYVGSGGTCNFLKVYKLNWK